MNRMWNGIGAGVALLAGCGECPEVCTEVPVEVAGWDARSVGPEQSAGSFTADTAFEAVVPLGANADGEVALAVLDGGVLRVVGASELTTGTASAVLVGGGGYTGLAAADVDGDGVEEVLAGNGSRWEAFAVADLSTPLLTVTPSAGAKLVSMSSGDVDGDGQVDLLVSQYFADDPRGREEVGRLRSHSGAVSMDNADTGFGAVTDLDRPHSLVSVGDIDGDGTDDMAAGAARNFAAVHLSAEWASGPFGGLSNREVHVHECYPNPDGCSSQVEVRAPGDVDGDGVPDLIVNGVAPASAFLVPGSDMADNTYKTSLFSGQLVIRREITGADALVPAGDVDGALTGDGNALQDVLAVKGDTAWLIVGQQLTGQAALDVGQALHVFEGFAPGGQVLAQGVGDVNGDGLGDLLVGDEGALHLLLAPENDAEPVFEEVCEVSTEKKRCR